MTSFLAALGRDIRYSVRLLGRTPGVTAGQNAGQGLLNGSPRAFRLTPVAAADTTPPVFTGLSATPSTIWPPRGQLVTVTTTAAERSEKDVVYVLNVTCEDRAGNKSQGSIRVAVSKDSPSATASKK